MDKSTSYLQTDPRWANISREKSICEKEKMNMNMNHYIGTKIVEAEPANRVNGKVCSIHDAVPVGAAVEEGYKVRYEDGYESWSPKEVFEEAYRPTGGMNFGLALEAAKKGERIARAGWNGKGQWVELGKNIYYQHEDDPALMASHYDIGSHALVFCGTRGRQVGWLASQSDMLAEDWMVLHE